MTKPKAKKLMAVKKKKDIAPKQAEPTKVTPVKTDRKESVKQDGLFQGIHKQAEFDAFISWIAKPSVMREPATQLEFAKQYKISPDLLADWKKRSGFYDEVIRRRRVYFEDDAGDVILSLKRKCLKEGSGADVKVFLNYTEDLKDKTELAVDEELRQALKKVAEVLPD